MLCRNTCGVTRVVGSVIGLNVTKERLGCEVVDQDMSLVERAKRDAVQIHLLTRSVVSLPDNHP